MCLLVKIKAFVLNNNKAYNQILRCIYLFLSDGSGWYECLQIIRLGHNASLIDLIMIDVRSVYRLSPGFIASLWSAGFRTFHQVSALTYHWLEDIANFTLHRRKTTNTTPTALLVQ
jgi:hypothetical protein